MAQIRIEVLPGTYSNDDAYENVINYIYQKKLNGAYGVCGTTSQDCINQFRNSEDLSIHYSPQYIWHFIVSFEYPHPEYILLRLAYQIASRFREKYQVIFGIDTTGSKQHIHFCVNAYSYLPDYPVLTSETMLEYMNKIQNFLSHRYPSQSITLQFQNKRSKKSCSNY